MRLLALLFATAFLTLPATAWEGAEVQDSVGELRLHFWADPSPTPGWCYWDSDPDGGPLFQASNADGSGNMGCTDPWFVHCDGDSLVYRGSWPYIEALYLRSAEYLVTLSCEVKIEAETRLVATRSVDGNLDTDEHDLTLVYKDGTILPILERNGGPDEAQIILQPGTFTIILHVTAQQTTHNKRILDPYEGSVVMKLEDASGVAVENATWGAVKATFR
jgi:hypothetical protein